MSAVTPRVGVTAFIEPTSTIDARLIDGSHGVWLNFAGAEWGGVDLHFQSAEDMQRVADAISDFNRRPGLGAPDGLSAMRAMVAAAEEQGWDTKSDLAPILEAGREAVAKAGARS